MQAGDNRIAELEHEIVKMRGSWQETVKAQAQRARAMEERLKQTEGLLKVRSAELYRAQTFLSTADRLSEMEVLGIVRDLNENIYQATVSLTEEWENLESSQTTGRRDVGSPSQFSNLRSPPGPTSPQPGPHQIDPPTSVKSLFPGGAHDFELETPSGVEDNRGHLSTVICIG